MKSSQWLKILIIFLPINLSMCFGCSKEPSHRDSSFEYPQHMFWMRNKENNFPIRALICRLGYCFKPSIKAHTFDFKNSNLLNGKH